MKKMFFIALFLVQNACNVKLSDVHILSSPDNSIDVRIELKEGELFYSVKKNNIQIITPSKLGLVTNAFSFDSDISLLSVKRKKSRRSWSQVWGEQEIIDDHHNEIFLRFASTQCGG